MFWTSFGRPELILDAPKATYCEELDFEVCFYLASEHPDKTKQKKEKARDMFTMRGGSSSLEKLLQRPHLYLMPSLKLPQSLW